MEYRNIIHKNNTKSNVSSKIFHYFILLFEDQDYSTGVNITICKYLYMQIIDTTKAIYEIEGTFL